MSITNTDAFPEPSKVRVVLADDSAVMLNAIGRLLRASAEIDLVGVASEFGEAVRLSNELRPDVVVLDLHMAERASGDALTLRQQNQRFRLVAVTAALVNGEIEEFATKMGAEVVLDKMTLYETLVPAILKLGGCPRT